MASKKETEAPEKPTLSTEVGREFHGATIEEAVAVAAAALGTKEEEISFEVVDRGANRLLGAGKRRARIKLKAAEHSGEERGSEPGSSSSKVPTPAKATSPPASRTAPANQGGEYYTDVEVANKLGQPYPEILAMANSGQLPGATFVDDRRVFHKQVIDDMAARKAAPRAEANEGGYYYTPGQAAQLLGKDAYEINQMIHQNKLPVVRVNDYRWIPAQAVKNLLPEKLKRRLKKTGLKKAVKPHRIHIPEKKGSEDEEKPPTDPEIQQKPGGYRSSDSASAPEAPTSGHEKPEENDEERSTLEPSEPRRVVHDFLETDTASLSKETDASEQRVTELGDEVRDPKATLRADKEHWERELQREREGRKQDNLDARYEIDQLDAEIANLHREYEAWSETAATKLKEERALRIESERRAEELQRELDEERELRLTTEESLGPAGLDWHERDEYEERLAALSYELEEERKKSGREEWTSRLQSRLEESEAKKQTLEEALSSEKEKTRRLETEKRLLDQVRRLLGATEAGEPSEPDVGTTSENVNEHDDDETSGELLLQTPFGPVSFRPPFPLDEREVELVRLVAGEDEITADQIKRRTGRRRATDDLDDLLDRLYAAGIEPIKEVNDRYSFDPDFMQD